MEDEREFSAIYESIEDSGDSDMEDYVTVSEPSASSYHPGPYLCPEPKGPAPPPPSDSPDGGRSTRGRLKLKQPIGSSHTHPRSTVPQLPPKPGNTLPYQRHVDEDSPSTPPKPRKLPKPGALLGKRNKPAALPRNSSKKPQTPPPDQRYKAPAPLPNSPAEEENQYDSIKETRKMLKARREYKRLKSSEETSTPILSNTLDEDGDDYIKMQTFSSIKGSLAGSSDDLLVSSSGAYQTRVVCIVLGITVTSLLIAVVSLVLALYSVVALTAHTRATAHCNTTMLSPDAIETVDVNTTSSPPLNETMNTGDIASVNCMVMSVNTSTCEATLIQAEKDQGFLNSYCTCTCHETAAETILCSMAITKCSL